MRRGNALGEINARQRARVDQDRRQPIDQPDGDLRGA
jgi:hypothetical protein